MSRYQIRRTNQTVPPHPPAFIDNLVRQAYDLAAERNITVDEAVAIITNALKRHLEETTNA